MYLRGLLGFICLMDVWWLLVVGDSCPYKECTCDSVQILCQSKRLYNITPVNTNATATYKLLFLDGNHITSIKAGDLLPNLTELSLSNNPITTLEDHTFDGSANTLEILTLSNAHFTRIPNALLRLKSLKYFSISNTRILDWNFDAMKNIGLSVETLQLGNVSLTAWPTWIQYFTSLTDLSVIDSSISSIPDNALDMVANTLRKLVFINCKLTLIPRSFANLRVLQELIVEGAHVTNLTWMPRLSNLSIISLVNNSISDAHHVSQSLNYFSKSLEYLDLQYNHLTSIPLLSSLTVLQDVNFNHNHINVSENGSLPSGLTDIHLAFNFLSLIPSYLSRHQKITYLNIPRNSIKEIRGTDFPLLTVIVDLGYNLIIELSDTSFPQNSSIEILTLNNNPIVTVSIHAFQNLPVLSSLNLQYTKLTRLPLALSSLSGLNRLDVSGTPGLVCTCLEKSLKSVVLSIFEVDGKCGETGIREFFTNLSSSCPI